MSGDTCDNDQLDAAWKYLLEQMFPEFLQFYFPDIAAEVDWCTSRETAPAWKFLNQELNQIHPEGETGARAVDKLVEVRSAHGAPDLLYLHIEVQSQSVPGFAERMFTYAYRIFDRFRRPVSSLAVLADNRPAWRPCSFELSAPGTRFHFQWSTVKLLDYRDYHDLVAPSTNPFAWVTRAHLMSMETKGCPQPRQQAKRRLMRQAASHGWERGRIIQLLRGLEFMMRLPRELNLPLWQEIGETLGEEGMELMFDFEIEAMEKGREEGLRSGLQQGIEQGREAEAALVLRMLSRRFGTLSPKVTRKVQRGTFEELERWGFRLLDANSLDDVFAED